MKRAKSSFIYGGMIVMASSPESSSGQAIKYK